MATRGRNPKWLLAGLMVLASAAAPVVCAVRDSESVKRANAIAESFVAAVEQGAALDAFSCDAQQEPDPLAGARAWRACDHTRLEWRDVSMFDGPPLLTVRVYCRDGRMWRFTVATVGGRCGGRFIVSL